MTTTIGGLTFTQPLTDAQRQILTADACAFVARLVADERTPRDQLLQARQTRTALWADGTATPDFADETAAIRAQDWRVAPLPPELQRRCVEITGPVDRKMVINALNANVDVFMADFEDSLSPTWHNIIEGQINLRDACRRTIRFEAPDTGKTYQLHGDPAVLFARVRGIHLDEKHVLYEGRAIPGCLLDFGLYLWHNAASLAEHGSAPYFYIPKLESHTEARWWNNVLLAGQQAMGIAPGTVRVTCLIETLPAVFEMEEILWELRQHIAALNCGRWDYIFSAIKALSQRADRIMPDRAEVSMHAPFLGAYARLLIATCHKRGALAIGGMSNFIPQRDPEVNKIAMEKVAQDKQLEASRGHDGTWIAHPGLAEVARQQFAPYLNEQGNQLHQLRADDTVTADDLLAMPPQAPTEEGVRTNVRIALQYLAAWLSGNGCVPIYGLMEDAATAEISRASVWQIVHHRAPLADGQTLDAPTLKQWIQQETRAVASEIGASPHASQLAAAAELIYDMSIAAELAPFLTVPAYERI